MKNIVMHKLPILIGVILCMSILTLEASAEPLKLNGPAADHAVIQRNTPIIIRGTGSPSDTLEIRFADQTLSSQVDENGDWEAVLGPLPAGGPYTLSVHSATDQIVADDILIGDVWLCSGQSNMEYPVYRALNPDAEMAGPHSDQIRLFSVPQRTALQASSTFPDAPEWKIASPNTVRDFSAVCYFTAKRIFDQEGVPLGLIDSSWGGSQIEAWLSKDALEAVGGFDQSLDLIVRYRSDPTGAMLDYGKSWQDWWSTNADSQPWHMAGSFEGWSEAPEEMQDWNSYGDPELEGYTGRLWFSRSFTLSDKQAREDATLSLGVIDEKDLTWVNGRLVGTMDSWSDGRTYQVPSRILKSGQNTIIVMAENGYGAGGMMGPDEDVYLSLSTDKTIDLSGNWRYRIAQPLGYAPAPPWSATSGFTTIYNAMIAPLGHYPMAGALWYQGESNTGRGEQYQALMQNLVVQWRGRFGTDLPVIIVQLPGYGGLTTDPGDSGWSQVREGQRQVALGDDRVGLVVAMDAGDRFDIHPANKQILADRAVDVLEAIKHGDRSLANGQSPLSATRSDQGVILTMPTDALKTVSHSQPIGFTLCDSENQCEWADANLSGNKITVTAQSIPAPTVVKYCWGDAPICNLFDMTDTPVSPFKETIK